MGFGSTYGLSYGYDGEVETGSGATYSVSVTSTVEAEDILDTVSATKYGTARITTIDFVSIPDMAIALCTRNVHVLLPPATNIGSMLGARLDPISTRTLRILPDGSDLINGYGHVQLDIPGETRILTTVSIGEWGVLAAYVPPVLPGPPIPEIPDWTIRWNGVVDNFQPGRSGYYPPPGGGAPNSVMEEDWCQISINPEYSPPGGGDIFKWGAGSVEWPTSCAGVGWKDITALRGTDTAFCAKGRTWTSAPYYIPCAGLCMLDDSWQYGLISGIWSGACIKVAGSDWFGILGGTNGYEEYSEIYWNEGTESIPMPDGRSGGNLLPKWTRVYTLSGGEWVIRGNQDLTVYSLPPLTKIGFACWSLDADTVCPPVHCTDLYFLSYGIQ